MEQLDYDYSVAAADQPKPSELLWYDYGGSGSGDNYYGGQISAVGDKRAGGSTQSNSGIWFGPRLGRRKRHGGFSNVQQVPPIDATVIGPEVLIGQPSVADLIENAPWAVLVPIIDSTREYDMNTPVEIIPAIMGAHREQRRAIAPLPRKVIIAP